MMRAKGRAKHDGETSNLKAGPSDQSGVNEHNSMKLKAMSGTMNKQCISQENGRKQCAGNENVNDKQYCKEKRLTCKEVECWQWTAMGQCSYGKKCKFVHGMANGMEVITLPSRNHGMSSSWMFEDGIDSHVTLKEQKSKQFAKYSL